MEKNLALETLNSTIVELDGIATRTISSERPLLQEAEQDTKGRDLMVAIASGERHPAFGDIPISSWFFWAQGRIQEWKDSLTDEYATLKNKGLGTRALRRKRSELQDKIRRAARLELAFSVKATIAMIQSTSLNEDYRKYLMYVLGWNAAMLDQRYPSSNIDHLALKEIYHTIECRRAAKDQWQ